MFLSQKTIIITFYDNNFSSIFKILLSNFHFLKDAKSAPSILLKKLTKLSIQAKHYYECAIKVLLSKFKRLNTLLEKLNKKYFLIFLMGAQLALGMIIE